MAQGLQIVLKKTFETEQDLQDFLDTLDPQPTTQELTDLDDEGTFFCTQYIQADSITIRRLNRFEAGASLGE